MQIITGRTGVDHVIPEDDAQIYEMLFGSGNYVLPSNDKLAAEVVNANTIRVKSGDILIQGRQARIRYGGYDDITIENGSTGYNRNDLIVARYTNVSGVESVTLEVLKGTPTTGTATDPEITTGDINEGDTTVEFALHRVKLAGITPTVEAMFTVALIQQVNAAADYIVEQGTTNGWNWEKRNSGKCRLQWCGNITMGTGTAFIGGYFHTQETAFTLPFTVNNIKVMAGKSDGVLKVYLGSVISNNTIKTIWLDGASTYESGTQFGYANIIVDGTWK